MVRPAPVRDARFDLSSWAEPKRGSSRTTEKAGKKKRVKREASPAEKPSEHEEQPESDADDGNTPSGDDNSANNDAPEDDNIASDDDASEVHYDDAGSEQDAASDYEHDMADANDDGDAHDLHDSEHAPQRVLTPESLKEYANKQQKRGIVYVSRIPPGMTPAKVRHIFSQFGEVGRIYLQPKDKEPKGAQKRKRTTANFSEGWVEYLSKRVAKTAAEMMNAQPIGSLGATHERAAHAARLRMELAQSAHEQRDYLRKVERSRIQREKEAKRAKRGLPQEPASSTFEFQQRTPVYRDVRDQRAAQRAPAATANPQMDRVLDQIL
ncbi:RNA-binding ATPase activator esf2 [Malassezia brasiliensis]|uniref:18S rRNA factor 2 n=1 Tax=Malassezia brasiliensis TaxID=1821822 RepID=A0AAF0DW03_9BASI|nr:RNA-binding ATPase activator esf2 [Malassezia brasiliensis]